MQRRHAEVLFSVVCITGFVTHALADEIRPIHIPAGELTAALDALARQSNADIVYLSEQLAGVRTAGLSGTFSSQAGVLKLLESTNFTSVVDASGAILIARKPTIVLAANSDDPARASSSSPDGLRVAATDEGTSASAAGTQLEEVIVTAERRKSDIQSTATSVSVRTGRELAAQGRYSTRQILDDVPGLTVLDNNSLNVGSADVQGNNITIRGITPGDSAGGGPSQLSATPPTAIYVDGIYEGIGSNFDIDRVEVLRGPQGTLYGRSATAGVVGFHTRNPTLERFEGTVAVEAGNYDLQHYTGAVNIPITSDLAVRVAGDYHDQGKGYYGDANRGLRERTDGRAKVLWNPTDTLSLLAGFAYQKDDANSGGNSSTADLARNITTTTVGIYPGHKESRQYWADFNWDLGPVTLTYVPAFRDWTQDDLLLRSANFIQSGVPLQQNIQTPLDEFHTQELRFASNEGSMIRWQAGAFYYRNKLHSTNHNYLAGPSGAELAVQSDTNDQKDTKNLGYFAEATLSLSDAMRVTLGARYDDTRVIVSESFFDNPYSLCGTALQFTVILPPGGTCIGPGQASVPLPPGDSINGVEINFHNFNYKGRFEYDLTPKNLVYAMISTGFRPGDAGIASHALNVLAAEKLTSIEIGSKNRFLQDSLQLNVGVYRYRYQGFQTTYIPDTPSPVDPANPNALLRVTVPARNLGGELELLYQLTAHDRAGFNYNHVVSRWHDKPAGFALAQPEEDRAMTPTTVTANYEHVFELPGGSTWLARIDGKYESSHLTDDLHVDYLRMGLAQYFQVASRVTGNLNSTWSSAAGRYSVSAYVRNFTNKRYVTYTLQGDPTNFLADWTDPRTYGIVVSAAF